MVSAVPIVLLVIAGIFALWAVAVAVYLVGAKMTKLIKEHEHVESRGAIWGWGIVHTLTGLVVLFLLVRFVKFAWTLE